MRTIMGTTYEKSKMEPRAYVAHFRSLLEHTGLLQTSTGCVIATFLFGWTLPRKLLESAGGRIATPMQTGMIDQMALEFIASADPYVTPRLALPVPADLSAPILGGLPPDDPMDIGALASGAKRAGYKLTKPHTKCYKCGGTGHFAANCPSETVSLSSGNGRRA